MIESSSWHHAGPNRLLVCHTCQLFFFKYGEMPPITGTDIHTHFLKYAAMEWCLLLFVERGSPPQVLFKDYHKVGGVEWVGRGGEVDGVGWDGVRAVRSSSFVC